MSRLQAYVTSRLLAALVVAVPVALWAFVPRDENAVEGFGVFDLTVESAVVLAVVAAFAADWSTRVPLYAAGFGWLVVAGVQLLADLKYDGMVGIGDGFVALLGLATAAIAIIIAILTPLETSTAGDSPER